MILAFRLGSFENMYLEKLKSKAKPGAEGWKSPAGRSWRCYFVFPAVPCYFCLLSEPLF